MTRLLSFGAIWIFYVQVIGGNKSLCPSGETVAANSVHGTPFLAFKLGVLPPQWKSEQGSFRQKNVILHAHRRRQFESKNQIAPVSLTDYTPHRQTKIRNDGSLSDYRWGVERKRALLKREAQV
jgi:hypothetical protein